jgi:hypothetical protein
MVEAYAKEQGLWHEPHRRRRYTEHARRPWDQQDEEDEQEPGTEPEGRDTDEGRHGTHRGPDAHRVG